MGKRLAAAILVFCGLFVSAAVGAGKIGVFSPKAGVAWAIGRTYPIQWTPEGGREADVEIGLFRGAEKAAVIVERTPNNGLFKWKIPEALKPGPYRIRIEAAGPGAASESGSFEIVSIAAVKSASSLSKAALIPGIRDRALQTLRLPPGLLKPDFSAMEFDFVDSHNSKTDLPRWFILKYKGHADPRYLLYEYRLRENKTSVPYRLVYKYKDSPSAKEIFLERKILKPLKFTAPKYAEATCRRDAYEDILQFLVYRRYLVANGYFESGWDRFVDFITDPGNLFDLFMTITEAVFGDADIERIGKLARNFYKDCIEIGNGDLYGKCTTLWYEINGFIQEHFEETQFDYADKTDGVFNRISAVTYKDLKTGRVIDL